MAANISQPLRRAEVLGSPLSAFADWHLMATCPTCRMRRYVAVDGLVRRHGGERYHLQSTGRYHS